MHFQLVGSISAGLHVPWPFNLLFTMSGSSAVADAAGNIGFSVHDRRSRLIYVRGGTGTQIVDVLSSDEFRKLNRRISGISASRGVDVSVGLRTGSACLSALMDMVYCT